MSEPSTVLVVDDEIGPRESLRAILKPEYQVLVAAEGEQAIHMVEQTPVDVVLLDLRMPGVSGIRVLERIKAINPDIEVILITGYASYETVLEALRLHAFDYIPKPFNIPQLRNLVRRAVTQRHAYVKRCDLNEANDACERTRDPHLLELTAELTITRKQLEEIRTVLSRHLPGALRTLEEGAQKLAAHYASQLEPPAQEALQQVHTAALQIAKSLRAVLPQDITLKSTWQAITSPTPLSSACSQ